MAALGYAQPTASTPRVSGDLDRVAEMLSAHIARVQENNAALVGLISRVYGGGGETDGKEANRPLATGILGQINRQFEDIGEAIERNRALIDRLAALA